MIHEHIITTNKTAIYQTIGELNDQTQNVWFVLHGYGQLSHYFIQHFESLTDKHTFVVAPQGLSRFYLNGFSGRVGACWMTSNHREHEINDYLEFLNNIYNALNINEKELNITILGFSQGGATACRWAMQNKVQFNNLVLWSTVFPKDVEIDFQFMKLNKKNIYVVMGINDSFHKNTINNLDTRELEKENIMLFDGGHEMNKDVLHKLVQTIIRNKKSNFIE